MVNFGMVVLGVVAVVASSLSTFPHSLAYFNEMAGGAANGHQHLLHSNLDWGQDYYLVRDWMERNNIDRSEVRLIGYHRIEEQAAPLIGLGPGSEAARWEIVSATRVYAPQSPWRDQAGQAERIGSTLYVFERR